MNQTVNIPEAYKILEKTYIEELKSEAWLLKHEKAAPAWPYYPMKI